MNTDLLGLISHEELSLPMAADHEGQAIGNQDLPHESPCTVDPVTEVKDVDGGVTLTPQSSDTFADLPTKSDEKCNLLKSNTKESKDTEQPMPDDTKETDIELQFVYDTKEESYRETVLLLPFDENNTSSTDEIEPKYIDFEKTSNENKKILNVSDPFESIQADEGSDEEGLLLPDSDLSLNIDGIILDSVDDEEEIQLDDNFKRSLDENLPENSLGETLPKDSLGEIHSKEGEALTLPKDSLGESLQKDVGENLQKDSLDENPIDLASIQLVDIADPSPEVSLKDPKNGLSSESKSDIMITGHLHKCPSQESMEKTSNNITLLTMARGDDQEMVESDLEQTYLIPCVKIKDIQTYETGIDILDSANMEPSDSATDTKGVDQILNEHSSDDETEPKSEDVDGDVIEPESRLVLENNVIDEESDAEGQPEVTAYEEERLEDNKVLVYDHPFVSDVNVESVNYPVSCLAKEKKRKRKDSNLKDSEDHMKGLLVSLNLKHLKAFLRTSLWSHDHRMRGLLWQQACKYLHRADGNFYEEMVDELYEQRGQTGEVTLPSLVDFDNLPTYHLNTCGIQSVHKILAVMHHTNPDITHCPTLFGLVSVFLHYMTPSDAYNCAYGLLRSKETFIMQTKVSFEATKMVVRDLAKKYAKSAYVNLVRNTNNIDGVFDSWYWWIFKDLPFPHLVCIIDCFILEGIKVFYRAALAILILYTKHAVKRTRSSSKHGHADPASSIRQFCREFPFRTDKLLRTGFGIRGLTRKHIKKLQLKNEMYINSRHLHPSASSQSMNGRRRANSGPTNIHMEGTSTVLTQDMLYTVWSWLPPRFAVCQPELLYTSEEHGTSLMTLYTRVEDHQPTLIVIKTTNDEVFGAFCSTYWRDRKHRTKNLSYFGTGETFIFTLNPKKQKYPWVGLQQEDVPNTANMFLAGDNSMLTVGGGNGEAIQLDANLLHCRTEKCDTFHNDPLCVGQDFTCKVVEVYGFV